MPNRYNPQQAAIVDQAARAMATQAAAAAGVNPLSTELNDIWSEIDNSTIGAQSAGADIDSMCLGGGEFTQDTNTASGASLLFAWLAGRFHNGMSLVSVAAGSLTLASSSINYVEVNRLGVVSSNTTGFTAGRLPLWIITTGAGAWVQSNVLSVKPHMTLIGANGVNGAMLSSAGQTKELTAQLGASITAATSFLIPAPNFAATLAGVRFVNSSAVAQSDTNYWTWSITNKAAGTGTNPILDTGTTNTTKVTGGSALAAYTGRSLLLNGTSANLNTNPNDTLLLTLTPTGSPTALTLASIALDFVFTG